MIDPLVLASLPPFVGVRPATLHTLARRAVERDFPSGATLWTAGSEPRGLFVVRSGEVRVLRFSGGRRHVAHVEGPGGTLGEVPLFEGGRYPATAEAVRDTSCVVIDRAGIAAAMAEDPELAWRFLARLASRVRVLLDRLDGLAGLTTAARLATYLLARAAAAPGGRVIAYGSQARLAEEVGTVREVVVRALRELREAGLVRSAGRGRVELLDAEGLERAATT